MPKGPQGQKRPGDVIGAAVLVGKIATGEIEDNPKPKAAAKRAAGKKGGAARAAALDPQARQQAAQKAAAARWEKRR